jgi:hypothetical protein
MTSKGGFERAPTGSLLDVARDDLIESLRLASRRAWLASPFLSASIAELIAEAASLGGAADLRMLTALGADPVRRGVLSLRGLQTLADAGFKLRSVPNLHAKAAVIDANWGLAGSGNLTVSGMGSSEGNVELGVVLTRAQVSAAARHLSSWWHQAEPIDEADFDYYGRWSPRPGSAAGRGRASGPSHGSSIKIGVGRELSRLRAERAAKGKPQSKAATGRSHWLKMLYYDGRDPNRWWEEMTWVSDVHRLRKSDREPLLRPRYRVGDLLVLYLVGEACPAIAEVNREASFEPERVRRDSNRKDAGRWGWVTEVRVIHRHEAGLTGAPGLEKIGVAPSSVRRHGHIRISPRSYAQALRAIAV